MKSFKQNLLKSMNIRQDELTEKDQKDLQKFLQDQEDRMIKQYCESTGHRVPVTRREFLGSGLIASSAYVMAPTMAQMLMTAEAHAQASCGSSDSASYDDSLTPMITLSLNGGACLNAHHIPLDEGGQFLSSYTSMGRGAGPSNPSFRTVNVLGGAPYFWNSTFLRGMYDGASGNQNGDITTNLIQTAIDNNAAADPTPGAIPGSLTGQDLIDFNNLDAAGQAAYIAARDENGDGDPDNDANTKSAEVIAEEELTLTESLVNSHPALGRTASVAVCTRSLADNSGNKFIFSSWLEGAGYNDNRKVPFLGDRDSMTGVDHDFAGSQPSAPLVVNGLSTIAAAMGAATNAMATLTKDQRVSLFSLIENLSNDQARNLTRAPAAQVLGELAECATAKNVEAVQAPNPSATLVSGSGDVADVSNPDTTDIWGAADDTDGAMVMSVLRGYSGACLVEMGGYDYHGNPRATTDQRDYNAGRFVGQCLESARRMNRKVMIQVISDGACSSGVTDDPEAADWATDSSNRAMTLMFVFDPSGDDGNGNPMPPAVSSTQMGNYTSGQVANGGNLIGGNVETAAAAIFSNLLAMNGSTASEASNIVEIVSAGDLASYTVVPNS